VAAGLPMLNEPFEQSLRTAFLQFEGLSIDAAQRLQSDVKSLLSDEATFHDMLATVGGVARRLLHPTARCVLPMLTCAP
jgi:hypothetical protein